MALPGPLQQLMNINARDADREMWGVHVYAPGMSAARRAALLFNSPEPHICALAWRYGAYTVAGVRDALVVDCAARLGRLPLPRPNQSTQSFIEEMAAAVDAGAVPREWLAPGRSMLAQEAFGVIPEPPARQAPKAPARPGVTDELRAFRARGGYVPAKPGQP